MKRLSLILMVVLVSVLVFAGCSQPAPTPAPAPAPTPAPTPAPAPAPTPAPAPAPTPAPTPTPAPAPTPAPTPAKPARLVWATQGPGTSVYAQVVALSQIVNTYSDLMTILQPLPSPAGVLKSVQTGDAQFALQPYSSVYPTYKGLDSPMADWAKGNPSPNFRIAMGGAYFYWGWVTYKGSGIEKMTDLKGKKLAGKYKLLPGTTYLAELELKAYGIDPANDVTMVENTTTVPALQDLTAKKVDAAFTALGGAQMIELNAKWGAHIIPFEVDRMAQIKAASPTLFYVTAPPTLTGVTVATPSIATPHIVLANKDVGDEAVYATVKAILEHIKDYVAAAPEFAGYTKDVAIVPDFLVPYHPGAIKYFKEQGIWTAAMDAQQQKLLTP